MRVLHTSDLHINSPLTSRLSPSKVRERKAELISTFERMVEEAVYQKVNIFIIAGDLFDSERITRSLAERILAAIEAAHGIDFLYLSGNHEKSALLQCGVSLPENLKIFGEDWTYFDYGVLTVAGRSVISAGMFNSLNLDYAKTNIVVLHGAVTESHSDGELIGIREARERHIDYMALGHYHSFSETPIDDDGVAVYSGTPEGRGFDEVGSKGFVIIDADGKNASYRFKPFAKRTLRIVDTDISGITRRIELDARIADSLEGIPHSDLIRLRLTGERDPEFLIDTDAINSRWNQAFYHFEINDDTATKIDPDAYKYDRSLKGEFIRLVLSKNDLSDTEKEKIIRTGLAALMGESDKI